MLRAADGFRRHAGDFRYVNAVGPIGPAGLDAVQEHNFSLPLAYRDVEVADALGSLGNAGEFVVVRGEERTGSTSEKRFGDCPRQAQPVEGAGAAADLVEDHQAAAGGVVEDVRGFGHLHHEG